MTKNKRFTMYQNTIYDDGSIINPFECMKCLNHLNDENKQLKSEIGKQQEEIEILSEENEQLKSENKRLKKDLEHCANQFTDDGKNLLLSLR